MKTSNRFLYALFLSMPALAFAAGGHEGHGMSASAPAMHAEPAEHAAAGMAGDPAKVTRTIPVEMNDGMRFTPDQVTVKAGETVRFFIVNKGKLPHEMVIGTAGELKEHAEKMRKMPGMVHQDANQMKLAPGQRGAIVWTFTKAGTVNYACLVPGHMEAGMVGSVLVQ
ncbi:MAG: cupredoxin family protein [Rubrivivax sp.]